MGTPSAPEPGGAARAALIGLGLAVLLCGPAWVRGEYVGSAGAETYGHAWVQAWAADAWPAWPVGTDRAAGAAVWPILDRLPTWLAAGLAQVVGLRHAWNLLVAGGVVLAALGGDALARAWGGARGFGAVALPLMPIWLGSVTSGLTEDLAVGLLALTVAAAREGRWTRAGLGVGALAWCGLYLAWMGAAATAVLGLAALARRHGTRDLAAGAVLAALVGLPAALPFRAQLGGGPTQRPPAAVEPRWPLNPWLGADLLSFVAPGKVDTGGAALREHPTYLGYTTLALAAAGGGPAGWAAVGVVAAASLGEQVSVGGTPSGVGNPAAWALHRLPMGDRFRNHARLMLLGQLILVAMAARGAQRLRARREWAPAAATLLLVAEVALVSPARAPLPGTPAAAPAIYAAIARAPAALPLRVVGAPNPQAPLFDQRAHGRRLLNSPNRPDPGRPKPDDEVIVAFGEAAARLQTELGPPKATADGAAAWWPEG